MTKWWLTNFDNLPFSFDGPQIENQENEKKDKYLDLSRELKKRWNMRIMVIVVVIGAWNGFQTPGKGTG